MMKRYSFLMLANIESEGEDATDALHRFLDQAKSCGLRIRQQKNAVNLGEIGDPVARMAEDTAKVVSVVEKKERSALRDAP
jgi:hypothetical protein